MNKYSLVGVIIENAFWTHILNASVSYLVRAPSFHLPVKEQTRVLMLEVPFVLFFWEIAMPVVFFLDCLPRLYCVSVPAAGVADYTELIIVKTCWPRWTNPFQM